MQLPATATLAEASALVKQAEAAVMQGITADGGERGVLRVDAGALAAFDTSIVAVLLHARRLALGAGRGFELVGAPTKLSQLARLYGVEELLGLTEPKPAAPNAVPNVPPNA
jgi:phospholipid transport system transporter-binding protein